MGRNIEIKARVDNLPPLAARAAALADEPPTLIRQRDTFFTCERGRFKLRDLLDGRGELIFYQRADQDGPKQSSYHKVDVADPHETRECLAAAYGSIGEVRKQRTLYLVGQTRIHLDQVEGLGAFLELEVVLEPEQSATEGEAIARSLMQHLHIDSADLVSCAYLDLLNNSKFKI